MFKKHSLFHLILVGTILLGTDATFAQTAPNRSFDPDSTQVFFKPPSDEGMPGESSTSDAGSRGQCSRDTNPNNSSESLLMMAVVPNNNYGLTVAAHPSFFIYLPKTSARQIILYLKTENQHHSETVIPISGEAGIIKIDPRKDAPELEIGTKYLWTVVLVCGEKITPDAPGITATIRRIDPSKLNNAQIKQKSPIDQAVWYGEQGIWYDMLTALADAKSGQSNNQTWAKNWENLLQSVGLEAIATEPRRF